MQDAPAKAPSQQPSAPGRVDTSNERPLLRGRLGSDRKWIRAGLGIAAAGVLGAAGYAYWQYSARYPSTDNAYVQANVVRIAPLVTGPVSSVDVHDNMHVAAGQVLLQIDPAPFEAALKAAEARLSLLQQQSAGTGAQAAAAKANIDQAQAAATQARAELDRATVKAPVAGFIGKVRIRPGAIAQAGVSLFPLVDTSQWWVDANFKETELVRIAAGQQATVSVDLYPSHEFKGEVDSLSPASGTAFSLLPPENATGNWVKVTQRFPVRISLKVQPDDPQLRVGASASVTVDTSSKVANGVTP
jgi:membrane fusion protein (multidrug efflux system)